MFSSLFTLSLFTQNHFFSNTAHAGDLQPSDNWLVLGYNSSTNQIAVKNIYVHPTFEGTEEFEDNVAVIIDCGYSGMKDGQGVQLGVWDLKEGRMLQTWDVYKSGVSKAECTKDDEAKKQLTAAKDYYSKNGLDISKPLTEIKISKDNTFTLPKGDATSILKVQPGTVSKGAYDEEMMDNAKLFRIEVHDANGKVFHKYERSYFSQMGEEVSMTFPKAYVVDGKVILWQNELEESGRGGSARSHSFSPLLAIP